MNTNVNDEYYLSLEIGGTTIKSYIASSIDFEKNILDINIDSSQILCFDTLSDPDYTIDYVAKGILNKLEMLTFNNKSCITKIGISCFGPLEIEKSKEEYGKILNTPKKGWSNYNLADKLIKSFNIKNKNCLYFQTDVNAAVTLEYKSNIHLNCSSIAYITIGTGCGIGIISQGHLIKGLMHTEGGHINVKVHPEDKDFEGTCRLHGNCLEGLISNISIAKRKGLKNVNDLTNISNNDIIWDIEAYYIAQLCLSLLYLLSVQKIIIGGGIINRDVLLPKIQDNLLKLNNNYIQNFKLTENGIKEYVTRTTFKNNTGILSAFSIIDSN